MNLLSYNIHLLHWSIIIFIFCDHYYNCYNFLKEIHLKYISTDLHLFSYLFFIIDYFMYLLPILYSVLYSFMGFRSFLFIK